MGTTQLPPSLEKQPFLQGGCLTMGLSLLLSPRQPRQTPGAKVLRSCIYARVG